MWLVKYSVCLFKGHDCSELTSAGRDYTYCHRCGRIKMSGRYEAGAARPVAAAAAPRPVRLNMPIEKLWR